VIGIGFLGAIVTQLAATAGARVIAIARHDTSLELARSFGARETVVMDDNQSVIDAVQEITDGMLCRTAVEAVGLQGPLDLAAQLTGVGGRLVVAGYHQDGLRTVDMQLWNWRGIDVINAHERDRGVIRQGVLDAADAVAARRFDPTPLYTHRFPLSALNAAMDSMLARPPGFVKALLMN
jgi:threonine dehydrogenase-like Zn-dependent dehydrogenase